MVRISVDVVNNAYQFINPVKQRELSLRNLQIPSIENLGVTKDQFDVIDLSDNNVRKLNNLPLLKRLETLLLHNNRIQQIEKTVGEHLPNLKTLALTNNNIAEFGDIDPLTKCRHLEYLTLIGNPLTHKQHYRQYVIYKLKTVRVLDFRRVKLAERKAAKKLFKGVSGETLRRNIVRESVPLRDDEEQATAADVLKGRSAEEQNKIKELISSAKTLSEVEHLHSMLQSGRIPTGGGPLNDHGGGLDDEKEKENEAMDADNGQQEANNDAVPMETVVNANDDGQQSTVDESTASNGDGDSEPPVVVKASMSGMEMEDEDDD